ncbi:MAG: glycerophosphodiester phosphodiesterase family protein [Anaerolineales bacterium]|jgi:glycerophosphoryl diester phosphodiesterase
MAEQISRWNLDAPLVIAHRGASSIAPENTIPAIQAALEQGAHAVELDVKLSQDDVLFIHHDQTLDRTTDGSGRTSEWSWPELARLDAGSHHSKQFKGTPIPRLDEIFELFGAQLLYNLELTEYGRPLIELAARTIRIVEKYELEECVLYSSFNPLELWRAARRVGSSRVALLMGAKTPMLLRKFLRSSVPHCTYHPQDELVTQELIANVKRRNKRFNVWTVNDVTRMRKLLKWGVDGIITDVPASAVKLLNSGLIDE